MAQPPKASDQAARDEIREGEASHQGPVRPWPLVFSLGEVRCQLEVFCGGVTGKTSDINIL